MKIDFDAAITTPVGEAMREPVFTDSGRPVTQPVIDDGNPVYVLGEGGRATVLQEPRTRTVTLALICVTALTRAWPDARITEEETVKRFRIACRIGGGGVLDLDMDDRACIQRATDNWMATMPIYMMRARELLDRDCAAAGQAA